MTEKLQAMAEATKGLAEEVEDLKEKLETAQEERKILLASQTATHIQVQGKPHKRGETADEARNHCGTCK